MTKFIDSLDYMADHIKLAAKEEWVIMGIAVAKVSKIVARFCIPACPHFRRDIDGGPLCYYECDVFVFDKHEVAAGETVFTVVFGTNDRNPHEGVAWQVGETYLRSLLGDFRVDQLVEFYRSLDSTADGGQESLKEV